MSVQPELERSVLERKERDELQAIARALGAEPGSRARKADLVELILEQAGVTSSGSETVNGAEPAGKPKRGRPKAATNGGPDGALGNGAADERTGGDAGGDGGDPQPVGDDVAARASVDGDDGSDTADDGPADRAAGGDERSAGRPADGGRSRPETGRNDREDRGDGGDGGDGDDRNDRDDRAGRARSGQADGDGDGDGNRQDRGDRQGAEARGDGDSEQGNRRRRRRGRDRDGRDRDPRPDDQQAQADPVPCAGLLDLREEGYGFLRTSGYLPSKDDVYVSVKQVRQLGLRKGDHVEGASRPANRNEKNPALLRIDKVNGKDPEESRRRARFEDLTPLFPDEKLRMETGDPTNMTARIIDLVSPIGKGQRGLIVSPPKAGKTMVIKQIAKSIEQNNPEVHLMVLLVDERPEEVTDMRRTLQRGEVIASTFDRPSEEHTQVSELAIDRAKRLVEEGSDVVIILDGITRLARAYNLAAPATGRIMSGGIDTGALYPPKKFFGAARNIEEGGSLTILATALIETGSKMDEVIFEEFKGTGNMELRLDRRLAERRIYPALDVDASSTRHEELLFDRKQLQQVWRVRRALNALSSDGASPSAALERLMDGMKTFKSNEEFLAEAAKSSGGA